MDRIERIADAAAKLIEGVSSITDRMDRRRGDAEKGVSIPKSVFSEHKRLKSELDKLESAYRKTVAHLKNDPTRPPTPHTVYGKLSDFAAEVKAKYGISLTELRRIELRRD